MKVIRKGKKLKKKKLSCNIPLWQKVIWYTEEIKASSDIIGDSSKPQKINVTVYNCYYINNKLITLAIFIFKQSHLLQ